MNLEELKKRNAGRITKVTLGDGSEWQLCKLTAAVGMAIGRAFMAAGHTDPNGPEPPPEKQAEAYALLLSKTICDEAGNLILDSDEAREELLKLDLPTIQELGAHAQSWSLTTAKKN
jgi:uroporphyrinogen-III synthase